jgi:diguanylate cyclase (GGDEF)-like protein
VEISQPLLAFIIDRLNIGIFMVDRQMKVILWNQFMAVHSGLDATQVVGRNLFEIFPELPRRWLEKKIESVFILGNFAFTSWEQRPYLFMFLHDRPVTSGIDYMRQSCTFLPVPSISDSNKVDAVCISLMDMTDASIYQTQLEDALSRLQISSRVDGLTQIHNRHYWQQRLQEEIKRVERHGGDLSLILFDLDHFKSVNDEHGHLAGDEVLRMTAARVSGLLRSSDIFGRYGGEEFAVILPHTNVDAAVIVAERIRQEIRGEPIPYEGKAIPVTASLGVAKWTLDMHTPEDLIAAADEALYLCKTHGRDQCRLAYASP